MYKVALDKVNEAKANLEPVVLKHIEDQCRAIQKIQLLGLLERGFAAGTFLQIRGAFNKISSLSQSELQKGVVCANTEIATQGVAFSCSKCGLMGTYLCPRRPQNKRLSRSKCLAGNILKLS